MPQLLRNWSVRELSRRQLVIAVALIVAGIVVWSRPWRTSRTVEETTLDGVVFPDLVDPLEPVEGPVSGSRALTTPRTIPVNSVTDSSAMRVEISANTPLGLGDRQSVSTREIPTVEIPHAKEPTWFEGAIEAVDTTVR